jgi:DNA-binding NarL/FixJ family response regulator
MTTTQVSLLIVDDHDDWRTGMVSSLAVRAPGVNVSYAGPSVDEAIKARLESPGACLALVDAHSPDGSVSTAAVRALRERGIPVATISAHVEPEAILELIAAGALACILKSDLLDCLDDLIALAPAHDLYLTPAVAASLLTTPAALALTQAQRQALQWQAAGIPLPVALQTNGLGEEEYAAAIAGLVEGLRRANHGTETSS